jgi:hypothetical protein
MALTRRAQFAGAVRELEKHGMKTPQAHQPATTPAPAKHVTNTMYESGHGIICLHG